MPTIDCRSTHVAATASSTIGNCQSRSSQNGAVEADMATSHRRMPLSRDLEFIALYLRQVGALNTDQSGFGFPPWRVHIAFVVNVRLARC
jgi:hypothetical protein